jgi:hypothetical protein
VVRVRVEKLSKRISEQLLEALLFGRSACYVDWGQSSVLNKLELEIVCEESGEQFKLVKTVEHEGKIRLVIKGESSDEMG